MNHILIIASFCLLAGSISIGCSTSTQNIKTASDTNTASQHAQTANEYFITSSGLSYQFHLDNCDLTVNEEQNNEQMAYKHHLFADIARITQTLSTKQKLEHPNFFYLDAASNEFSLKTFEMVDDDAHAFYGIDYHEAPAKLYQLNVFEEADNKLKNYLSDIVEPDKTAADRIAQSHAHLVETYDFNESQAYVYFPVDASQHNAKDSIDQTTYNLDAITSYILDKLIPEYKPDYIDEGDEWYINFDGKSKIHQTEALEFTISYSATDRDTVRKGRIETLFRVAIDNQKNVYMYTAKPVFLTNMPKIHPNPEPEQVYTPGKSMNSYLNLYDFNEFVVGAYPNSYKNNKQLPMFQAAAAAYQVISDMDHILPVNKIQDLDLGFMQYSLVTGGLVPFNVGFYLDDTIVIDNTKAYSFSVGTFDPYGWNGHEFTTHAKIAVTYTGKIYTFTFEPTMIGKL